jgi:small subunit ribosomal protein S6
VSNYEAMIIFNPKLEEEALNAAVAKVEDVIKNGQGEIAKSDRWGKRRLAYEINDLLEGIYQLIEFQGPTDIAKELDRVLRISDDAIRHLIVKKS